MSCQQQSKDLYTTVGYTEIWHHAQKEQNLSKFLDPVVNQTAIQSYAPVFVRKRLELQV